MQFGTFDVGAHSLNISSWWMPPWLLYRPRLQEAFLKILAKDVLNTMVSYYDNLYYLNVTSIDKVGNKLNIPQLVILVDDETYNFTINFYNEDNIDMNPLSYSPIITSDVLYTVTIRSSKERPEFDKWIYNLTLNELYFTFGGNQYALSPFFDNDKK